MRQAVVLAGGLGTRLRGVVPGLPKSMALVAGRPFLEIQLEELARRGFGSVVLSLGYLAETIRSHFGSSYAGMRIDCAIEERPLGTGGALRFALQRCTADHVYVFNGDTFLELDVEAVERHWLGARRPIIVGRAVEDTARYGRLSLSPDGSRVIGFLEKGASGPGVINVGCYVLKRRQLDRYPVGTPFSLETDYLAAAVREEAFDVFVTKGHFIDIGVPEDYARAQLELARR
jgi:D-glycero-alpha-D-manno-heptose 1-phosphate guanylyltransferase